MLKRLCIFILLTVFIPTSVFAAEIYKAKGRKAIVRLQGLDVEEGDILLVQDTDGTEKARVRVTKVKRSMALVQLLNGQVNVGDTTIRSTDIDVIEDRSLASDIYDVDGSSAEDEDIEEPPTEANTYQPPPSSVAAPSRQKFGIGLAGGMSLNAMHLTFSPSLESPTGGSSEDITAIGLGFIAKAAVDYDISEVFGLRAFAGWQQFSVISKDSRDSGNCRTVNDLVDDCMVEMDLLTLSVQANYYFLSQSDIIQPWIGLGGGLIIPINVSQTALEQDPSTTGIVRAAVGGNMHVSSKLYLIPQVDFNYLISSGSKAFSYFINFQLGLMYSL